MDILREQGAAENNEPSTGRQRIPLAAIEMRPEDGQIRLPRGMSLDLGGIAKGWIAEQAAQLLSSYSPACVVNAGGDMFLLGLPEGELSWSVEIEDPRDPIAALIRLDVGPGAVATSSVAKRTWQQGGERRHHLIDPRTGEPAATSWLSVSVQAPHAHLAEVLAKALLIAGPAEADRIARRNPGIGYLAADSQGIVINEFITTETCDVC